MLSLKPNLKPFFLEQARRAIERRTGGVDSGRHYLRAIAAGVLTAIAERGTRRLDNHLGTRLQDKIGDDVIEEVEAGISGGLRQALDLVSDLFSGGLAVNRSAASGDAGLRGRSARAAGDEASPTTNGNGSGADGRNGARRRACVVSGSAGTASDVRPLDNRSTRRRFMFSMAASWRIVISKSALIRIAALAAILGAPIWQPVLAEERAKQHNSDSVTCPRSTFRVVVDVGHTATSPGADSARGVHEYEFNLKLADAIVQSLREAQFDRTVRLITSGSRVSSLFHRVVSAERLQGDLLLSIHHDSVPDHLKETWQYEGKKNYYSDRFSGYAIFVSNDNADRAGSLAFAHSLGQELQKRGLHYTPHYTFPVMGRFRRELVDQQAGVYGYDHLIVLRRTTMPAVLLEAGSIVNRNEELELGTPERRKIVAEAVTAAVEDFCASQGQTVADQPAAKSSGTIVTAPPQRARPALFSR